MKKSAVVFSFITLGCLVFFTKLTHGHSLRLLREIIGRSVRFPSEWNLLSLIQKVILRQKEESFFQGTNKRLDSISPDRMAFVFFNDTYSVYSYQDKKLVTKKYSELSEAHLLFTEEMFWTIVYNPFQVLQERYILPPSSARAVAKSPVSAQSRRDPDATVLISFQRFGHHVHRVLL